VVNRRRSYESRTSSHQVKAQLDSLSRAQQSQFIAGSAGSSNESTLVSPTATTFAFGSFEMSKQLLNEAAPVIYRLAMDSSAMVMSRQRCEWALSQVYGVLQDLFSRGIESGDSNKSSGLRSPRFVNQREDRHSMVNNRQLLDLTSVRRLPHNRELGLVDAASVEVKDDHQRMWLTFLEYQQTAPSVTTQPSKTNIQCRLYVESSGTVPAAACIVRVSELHGPQYQLFKTLSTCGVHPRDSPVFRHMKNGDTAAIQGMLSRRQISPNDRDEDGNTLLWVRVGPISKRNGGVAPELTLEC